MTRTEILGCSAKVLNTLKINGSLNWRLPSFRKVPVQAHEGSRAWRGHAGKCLATATNKARRERGVSLPRRFVGTMINEGMRCTAISSNHRHRRLSRPLHLHHPCTSLDLLRPLKLAKLATRASVAVWHGILWTLIRRLAIVA